MKIYECAHCQLGLLCTSNSQIFCVSQLSETRDQTLESLNQATDYRELKGNDPSTVDLVKKMEQVHENRLKMLFHIEDFKSIAVRPRPLIPCLCARVARGEAS